jgi:CelD/BcsL family acetyltransferase involved in cellulose biosynthesis
MLETVVLDDARDFAALEEEWEELYHSSPLATPFQSWAWLYSWWEFYGEPYELRLVTVRSGNLLVGLIPLMLKRRRGFGRLLFVGTGPTDYLDVLVREGWEADVSETGVQAIKGLGSWLVADLQQVRPEAAVWDLFRSWTGPRTNVWQDSCPVIEVKPWDELVSSLSKNHRSTVRRALRRAEADDVRCEIAKQADMERAARRLVAVSRERWEGSPLVGPEHWTQRFESHTVAAVRRMTARDLGGISEFWRDGEVVISDFWVSGKDFLGTYMLGASQEALRRYQWSSLYIWDAVNIARMKNYSRLDLLRGEEPYKLRWNPRVVPNHRLILGRNLVFCALYGSYHALRSRAKRYADSEDAPQWIKDAKNGYRVLRNRATRRVNRIRRS